MEHEHFNWGIYKKLGVESRETVFCLKYRTSVFKYINLLFGKEKDTNHYFIRYNDYSFLKGNNAIHEVKVGAEEGQKIMNFLQNINIPLVPKETTVGLDGHTYTFQYVFYDYQLVLHWWSDAIGGCEPMNDLVEMAFSHLQKDIRKVNSGIKNNEAYFVVFKS